MRSRFSHVVSTAESLVNKINFREIVKIGLSVMIGFALGIVVMVGANTYKQPVPAKSAEIISIAPFQTKINHEGRVNAQDLFQTANPFDSRGTIVK